mmetsp:Transcript_48617/g.155583  ORF Transcript_48617/g.155583 Transcript_48617/m.155583 type:complete len:405 (-) Transcript_48617:263-1477(-)|eukprot:CAMPEP_0182890292 /NCGR_PEP_ID=MMETSP0034_2-20130328/22570_1 /TAXON_ID=156128 /ORGANISM="Nephroselmis pyriformis, Strain CCMP717" /LENGTH=404 /DNA_ID=CAMNT_0025023829 /DNA_START=60 /DNA_END=1274 /DNA_ORIENTATION=+
MAAAEESGTAAGAGVDLKREQMVERLAAMDAKRQEEAEKRRLEIAETADPRESVSRFLEDFSSRRTAIVASLSAAEQAVGAGVSMDPAEAEALKGRLEGASIEILKMEKAVAEASYFLPAYDARSVTGAINQLKEKVASTKEALLPKKKFAFSRKKKEGGAGAAAAPAAPTAAELLSEEEAQRAKELERIEKDVAAGRGLKGLRNEVVVKRAAELQGLDYTLFDLEGCTVYLLGPMSALRLHRVKDCTIVAAPVLGSVFIDTAERCAFHLATGQIRIHTTTEAQFYARVRSKPIIEHTRGVLFAPLRLAYAGSEEQLQAARLDTETGLWEAVEDFGWLRATQSPNWGVLPEGERAPAPHIPGEEAATAGGAEGTEAPADPPEGAKPAPSAAAAAPADGDDPDEL